MTFPCIGADHCKDCKCDVCLSFPLSLFLPFHRVAPGHRYVGGEMAVYKKRVTVRQGEFRRSRPGTQKKGSPSLHLPPSLFFLLFVLTTSGSREGNPLRDQLAARGTICQEVAPLLSRRKPLNKQRLYLGVLWGRNLKLDELGCAQFCPLPTRDGLPECIQGFFTCEMGPE